MHLGAPLPEHHTKFDLDPCDLDLDLDRLVTKTQKPQLFFARFLLITPKILDGFWIFQLVKVPTTFLYPHLEGEPFVRSNNLRGNKIRRQVTRSKIFFC